VVVLRIWQEGFEDPFSRLTLEPGKVESDFGRPFFAALAMFPEGLDTACVEDPGERAEGSDGAMK